MAFKDLFSNQSDTYAKYRPSYPSSLFEYLASLCSEKKLVWDVATGNGQAALSLVEHFDQVVGTDASAVQISNAKTHARIEYQVGFAEDSNLENNSVDLVTVATGVHWFRHDEFYAEVKRVLKPGGILAVWCFNEVETENSTDKIIRRLEREIVVDYFADEVKKYVWNDYNGLPFPFDEIETPNFYMELDWSMEELFGYLGSWSAVQRYKEDKGSDPIELIRGEITGGSGDRVFRKLPVCLKVGKKPI